VLLVVRCGIVVGHRGHSGVNVAVAQKRRLEVAVGLDVVVEQGVGGGSVGLLVPGLFGHLLGRLVQHV